MLKPYSKEQLVYDYLEAEAKRAKSKSAWLLFGGIILGVIGCVALLKLGINENWAIIPGSVITATGLMWALADKSECDETFYRMRDCANLSPAEYQQIRDILN